MPIRTAWVYCLLYKGKCQACYLTLDIELSMHEFPGSMISTGDVTRSILCVM